jgi:hypothetical protein
VQDQQQRCQDAYNTMGIACGPHGWCTAATDGEVLHQLCNTIGLTTGLCGREMAAKNVRTAPATGAADVARTADDSALIWWPNGPNVQNSTCIGFLSWLHMSTPGCDRVTRLNQLRPLVPNIN